MHHQQTLARRGDMHGFLAQPDAGDLEAAQGDRIQPGAEHLVVVAGDVGDLGPAARLAQDLAQHLVVVFVPVPGFAQAPAVDDVADQEQMLAAGAAEEVREEVAARAAGAEMRIGNEYAAIERSRAGDDRGIHAGMQQIRRIVVDKVKFA